MPSPPPSLPASWRAGDTVAHAPKLHRAPSAGAASDASDWSRAVSPPGVSPPAPTSPLAAAVAAGTTPLAMGTPSYALPSGSPRGPGTPAALAALAARRAVALGANVASATAPAEPPLALVAAAGAWMVDIDGRRYLDAQNNVAAVGHAHPGVTAAVAEAWETLNTNVRYAHPAVVDHAERVRALLPPGLDAVIYHTASGSEASDLALRIALAASETAAAAELGGVGPVAGGFERHHVAVLAGAYHGHAGAAASISPYYHFGSAPGSPPPAWVHVIPTPSSMRGIDVDAAAAARAALTAAAARGGRVCAFIFESVPSCAGQTVLPPGWLAAATAVFRAAGAAIIADEVQSFARTGHVFAFTRHLPPSSPPDAVILGKGIANGYPIGAVAVSRPLAAPFAARGRFFSTFGGSTAAAAAAIATLDAIQRGDLVARAAAVGSRLLSRLRATVGRHPAVGEVRGTGLMLGLEFVRRGAPGLPPAPAAAAWVAAACRARGLLISADGFPVPAVLKIKPPLVFSDDDARVLVTTLAAVVSELPVELYM